MEGTLPPTTAEEEMTGGNDGGSTDFVEQEECSFLELPKRGSSKWTDEKHSLYLKSLEASFVNQLHNYLDTRNWKVENECSSVSMSSRRIHASNHCPSGQHGCWSGISSGSKNLVRNEANSPDVSPNNPWIQHFRNGNKQGVMEEKLSSTSCSSNTEVIDQNFVEEDSGVQMVNTACSKKRKTTYAVHKSGNDQAAASFGHISCKRNH